jgi:hypothetical protein
MRQLLCIVSFCVLGGTQASAQQFAFPKTAGTDPAELAKPQPA